MVLRFCVSIEVHIHDHGINLADIPAHVYVESLGAGVFEILHSKQTS